MTRLSDLIQIHYDHVSLGDSTMADLLLVDTAKTENLVMFARTPRDVATYGRPALDPFDPDLTMAERGRNVGGDAVSTAMPLSRVFGPLRNFAQHATSHDLTIRDWRSGVDGALYMLANSGYAHQL